MSTKNEKEANKIIEKEGALATGKEPAKKKKKMKLWKKILIIFAAVLGAIIIAAGIVFAIFYSRVNYETEEDNKITITNVSTQAAVSADANAFENGDDIMNFLLIGVESIGYGENTDQGNTDCMIVLSINKKAGTVKMVSFMRDIYATMPGLNRGTKLNNVYNNGGGKLLTETIEKVFGITIDGRAVVKFSDFEKIIDLLGGVNITLTEQEASYLRSTNYISNPSNRGVYAGQNHLNGNQALGYSRVRKVPTASGKHDNEGRNERQRKVLMSIYNSYKGKSLAKLTSLVYDLLPLVYKTNIAMDDAVDLVSAVKDMNLKKIKTLNIPLENTYHSQHAMSGISTSVMNDFIIIDDIASNRKKLEKFISDDNTAASASPSASVSPSTSASPSPSVKPTTK